MANNLVKLIFEQFLEIVERCTYKSCIKFDECFFDYRVRELVGHRLIDVIYVVEEKCGRRRDAIVSIDFTNICYEDLTTCKWVQYLEKIAREFIEEICPKKVAIIREEPKKCRKQPPKWNPLPCCDTTTIIRKNKIVHPEPECEVIVEKECECVPLCERKINPKKHKVIIKYQDEKPWKCGDVSVLVESEKEPKHYFDCCKGNIDYNNHKWRKCCSTK